MEDGDEFPANLKIEAERIGESTKLAPCPANGSPFQMSLWKRNVKRYLIRRCLSLSDDLGHPEWFCTAMLHMSIGFAVKLMRTPSLGFPVMDVICFLREAGEEIVRSRREKEERLSVNSVGSASNAVAGLQNTRKIKGNI